MVRTLQNSPPTKQQKYAPELTPRTTGTNDLVRSENESFSGLPCMNEKQLAERWGVSVRTLQAARGKGSGVQFVRIGRSVRYRLEDVLAYEQAHLRTDTSERSR